MARIILYVKKFNCILAAEHSVCKQSFAVQRMIYVLNSL